MTLHELRLEDVSTRGISPELNRQGSSSFGAGFIELMQVAHSRMHSQSIKCQRAVRGL